LEQGYERIICVVTKSDEAPYSGIGQHLRTEDTRGMGIVDGATLQADAVK
jgi:hypothetical protein